MSSAPVETVAQDLSGSAEGSNLTASQGVFSRVAPELAILSVVLMWAAAVIVNKDTFEVLSPLAFVFVRFLGMTVVAFGVLLIVSRGEKHQLKIQRQDIARFVAAGITGYTLNQLFYSFGLDKTSAFSSALLISMVPLFTMLFLALRGESGPRFGWLGLGIATVGLAVFLFDERSGDGSLLGDILSLSSSVMFALYGLIMRPLERRYQPATYSAYTVLIGTIPILFIAAPEAARQDWTDLPAKTWLAIAYMVIFPIYLAFILWNWGISKRGAAVTSSYSLLTPIVAGVMSAVFLDETFGVVQVVGALLALAGLIVIQWNGQARAPLLAQPSRE